MAGGRLIGFIPFPKALALCEMWSVSSISFDGNHYTIYIYYVRKKIILISFNIEMVQKVFEYLLEWLILMACQPV